MDKGARKWDEDFFFQLGVECGTDKITTHGYHRFYPLHLSPLRKKRKMAVLEIGYGSGQSIPFWKALFPQSFVYCLDRDVSLEGDGFRVIMADQADPASISAAVAEISLPIYLVVDDGSHYPPHQLSCFSSLFADTLQESGVYIVEDIETSYWLDGSLYGYPTKFGISNRWSAVEGFKLASDYLNRTYLSLEDRSALEYELSLIGLDPGSIGMISTLTFGQNCLIARKGSASELRFIDRPYAHKERTSRFN